VSDFTARGTQEADFAVSSRQFGGAGDDNIAIIASGGSVVYGLGGRFDFDLYGSAEPTTSGSR
jgi:hypothetical protein